MLWRCNVFLSLAQFVTWIGKRIPWTAAFNRRVPDRSVPMLRESICQGTGCPKDATSKRRVVQWSHCTRDETSEIFRSGTPRSGAFYDMMVWSVEVNNVFFFANSSSMAGYQPTLTYCGQSLAGQPDISDTLLDRDVFNILIHIYHSYYIYCITARHTSNKRLITAHADPIQKNENNALDRCPKIMSIWLCVCISWRNGRGSGMLGCKCNYVFVVAGQYRVCTIGKMGSIQGWHVL